jgi:hypothetical protein
VNPSQTRPLQEASIQGCRCMCLWYYKRNIPSCMNVCECLRGTKQVYVALSSMYMFAYGSGYRRHVLGRCQT